MEGLCIALWRLHYCCRLQDGVGIFFRSVDQLSRIANAVFLHIFERFDPGLSVRRHTYDARVSVMRRAWTGGASPPPS